MTTTGFDRTVPADPPRILPMGDRALLAEYPTLEATLAAHRGLAASAPAWVVDLVPAARTVLVRFDPRAVTVRGVTAWLETASPLPAAASAERSVVIPTRYDGADLAETAEAMGLSAGELVARHSGTTWTSAFIGFAPGFAYLVADDPLPREIPRQATSRERVPAGSVALAGAFTGIYPSDSPGGWRLIGSTDATLWQEGAEPPALLAPGVRVRFEEVAR